MARTSRKKAPTKSTPRKGAPKVRSGGRRLYTLQVFLSDGPITEKFAKKNKVVSRTIQIRGDQTLDDLHEAIFDAFDREEEHLYEFRFGKRFHDPKGKRYELPMGGESFDLGGEPPGDATRTTIDSLRLRVKQVFLYWFDFGDDWYHRIDVVAIEDAVPRGKFPKLTERVGESPPQYIDWDEEEEG